MNEKEINELRKKLERMNNRDELIEYNSKYGLTIEKIKTLNKEQLIEKIIFNIDFRDFWRDYYS